MKIGLIAPFRRKANTYFSNNPHLRKFFNVNPYIPAFFHSNLVLAALTPDTIEVELIDDRVNKLTCEEYFDIVGIWPKRVRY